MHTLMAPKGGAVGMNAIPSIAFIVPLKQQRMMYCFQCGLLCVDCVSSTTARATTVLVYTCSNPSLPLMAADPTLPFSPKSAASKCLLWRFDVFGLVPIFHLSWCLGSKRVVLAYCSPFTIWAFTASCAAEHTCLPDMRASCWTVGAGPHDFRAAVWLHQDVANHSVVVRVPLLLQLGAELTDVWQV